ncbi:YlbD family protein [Cytobacillus horneckiae]|uniref:YlbD family protein n=1 Tax=Cytobacillus horneckiae TaxID=549687 RepID=UPI00203AA9BF|nr:YlbD family protein [Cytobacillus horneckiae]MCM3178382.1 YlbD family protein [Cytobacillus horneckiae]
MAKEKLHPSIEQFKQYVKAHPEIIKQVRSGQKKWQELYEEWYLLEDEAETSNPAADNHSKNEENTDKSNDWMTNVVGSLKNMDVDQMQGYIANMSQALAAIQGVISQFSGGGGTSKSGSSTGASQQKPNPFTFKKD